MKHFVYTFVLSWRTRAIMKADALVTVPTAFTLSKPFMERAGCTLTIPFLICLAGEGVQVTGFTGSQSVGVLSRDPTRGRLTHVQKNWQAALSRSWLQTWESWLQSTLACSSEPSQRKGTPTETELSLRERSRTLVVHVALAGPRSRLAPS